jgi:DHA2 family multidrug resistance protein-like MFS transporter
VGNVSRMVDSVDPPKATRREWVGLAVLALPCMLYSMDLTVLNLAVPHLTIALAPTGTQLLWIVDIYGFLVAGWLIPMGTLGDRIGRRRLLLTGAAAFGVASLLAAFSRSAEALIVTRAVLGVAAATLAPSTLSLLRSMFLDPKQRTFAVGVWVTSFSFGAVIGPLVGGALLQYFWWGSVFLIAVPVMLLLLVLGPMFLPEFRNPNAGRLDPFSALLSLLAVLTVIHGLKQVAHHGFTWLPLMTIAAGLAVGIAFVRRQRRLPDPLIDLSLFRVPAFNAALAANTLNFFANFGVFLFIAQYLQLVLGLTPWKAGLMTAPSSVGFIVGSMLTPTIVRRVRRGLLMAGGLVLAALGLGVLTRVGGPSALAILVTGSVLFAVGLAPGITLATDLIVGTAPPERAGAAAAIAETSSEFGGALGIAVLGSVGAAVYHGVMRGVVPTGLSSEMSEAARDTLGGAAAAAAGLADQRGVELMESARDAFARGFEVVAITGAVILIAAAAVAAWRLRDIDVAVDSAAKDQP